MKVKNQKSSSRDEFRKNKKTGHPAYIYSKQGNHYKYLGVTHSEVTNNTKNIRLYKNPNPKDKTTAYVIPVSKKGLTNTFKKKEKNWSLSKKDKNQLKDYFK